MQTVWLVLNTSFPSRTLEVWCVLGGGWLQSRVWVLSLWRAAMVGMLHMRCHNSMLEEWRQPVWLHLERALGSCLVASRLCPFLFSFADSALYPFAVTNHSLQYDTMLSPVSPPSEPPNVGVVLGNLTQQGYESMLGNLSVTKVGASDWTIGWVRFRMSLGTDVKMNGICCIFCFLVRLGRPPTLRSSSEKSISMEWNECSQFIQVAGDGREGGNFISAWSRQLSTDKNLGQDNQNTLFSGTTMVVGISEAARICTGCPLHLMQNYSSWDLFSHLPRGFPCLFPSVRSPISCTVCLYMVTLFFWWTYPLIASWERAQGG